MSNYFGHLLCRLRDKNKAKVSGSLCLIFCFGLEIRRHQLPGVLDFICGVETLWAERVVGFVGTDK